MLSILHSLQPGYLSYTGPVAFSERDGSIQPVHSTRRKAELRFKNLTTKYARDIISRPESSSLGMWDDLEVRPHAS